MSPTTAKRYRRGPSPRSLLAWLVAGSLVLVGAAASEAQPKPAKKGAAKKAAPGKKADPAAPETPVENPALTQVKTLNGEAVTDFTAYRFSKGMGKLRQALALAYKNGLVADPELAPTYILMGMGVIAHKDDLYRGLHYLTRAMRLKRKVGMPRALVTPQILRIYRSAKKAVKAVGEPPEIKLALHVERVQTALDTVRKDARGLVHEPVDEVKRGLPIPVTAVAGVDIRATKFFLYFRAAGKVKYERLPMKLSRGAYRGAIPGTIAKGRYVHYYIEARDQRGRVAASSGAARMPHVVTVKFF
jgi:hypothetical protein